MARLQVEQKSSLASKSSKSFFSSGGIIKNQEPSILSCVSHHYFAEVLAQQQCPKRPDDILPAHNDGHLGCWRRVLTRVPFGSIFRNFTVHRDRDKPVAGTILKLDDLSC